MYNGMDSAVSCALVCGAEGVGYFTFRPFDGGKTASCVPFLLISDQLHRSVYDSCAL